MFPFGVILSFSLVLVLCCARSYKQKVFAMSLCLFYTFVSVMLLKTLKINYTMFLSLLLVVRCSRFLKAFARFSFLICCVGLLLNALFWFEFWGCMFTMNYTCRSYNFLWFTRWVFGFAIILFCVALLVWTVVVLALLCFLCCCCLDFRPTWDLIKSWNAHLSLTEVQIQ